MTSPPERGLDAWRGGETAPVSSGPDPDEDHGHGITEPEDPLCSRLEAWLRPRRGGKRIVYGGALRAVLVPALPGFWLAAGWPWSG